MTLLISYADTLGLELPAERWEALGVALEWLGPASLQIGLTNYPDTPTFVEQLVMPLLPLLTGPAQAHLHSPALDFGAGSSAVGLSMAILRPDIEVILADRRARVVQFADLCIARLRLDNCSSLKIDLGNPPAQWRGSCGTVLIRAFGPTSEAIVHAQRLVRPSGSVALWHQPPSPAPPHPLRQVATLETGIPSLAITIYELPS
ncbi:MAG: RsmG family class I SAM-dependent methyltransferase [Armatimonadota bacterium]